MTDHLIWSDRHQLMAIAKNADQIERSAIQLGNAPVSAGTDDEKSVGVFDDMISEQGEPGESDWEVADEVIEEAEGDVLDEIGKRAELLGPHYPFTVSGSSIHYTPSQTGVYEFCLAASLAVSIKRKPFNKIGVQFEILAGAAVKEFLGDDALCMRTGWPSHDSNARPVKFKVLAEKIHSATGEWQWSPRPPNPDDPHPRQVKDEGIDFIVWKPMPDSRPGKMFVVGQCSCGDDWDEKLKDINRNNLERWFRTPTWAPWQTAFAVPRHITSSNIVGEMSSNAGLIFDRARITAIIESNHSRFGALRSHLSDYTSLVIKPS